MGSQAVLSFFLTLIKMVSTLSLAVCLLAACVGAQNTNLDMFGLINILYFKADINMDMKISKAELGRVYEAMDANNNSMISQAEFVGTWKVITGYSDEVSSAYFRLADMDRNGELDSVDNDRVYAEFDINGDGTVESNEFDDEHQVVYHEVPFVVLFERVEHNADDQLLDKTEFGTLFASFSTEADGSVTKANFEVSWAKEKFGTHKDADYVFDSLDGNSDGSLSKSEVEAAFSTYDKNSDGSINIDEIRLMGNVIPVV